MNNIFVSWKQKIESRIISDLKSQYTESEEQIRQRKEQFLKKQKKIILIEIIAGAVFLAFLIIRAAFLQDDILLSRNSFGQGSKEVQLSLKKDDKKKEITYKLDEQKLSAEEESKVYIQFFKKLKKIMMKNNTSLKQIQTPLNLPDTVDGYPFEITYELAEDGCEKCIHKGSSLSAIFVTAYGDCYHSTLGCSGLKRTIKAVRLKDVGRLRPCSRCASGR